MNNYTMTVGGGALGSWVSLDADGNEHEDEIDMSGYVVPPMGEYRLRFLRFAKPFEMPKSEIYGGGTQTMTRLELEIVGPKGAGKKIAPMLGWSVGAKAIFGQVVRAAHNRDFAAGEPFDPFSLAGKEFLAYVAPGDKMGEDGKPKYCKLSNGTIRPVSANGATDDNWED